MSDCFYLGSVASSISSEFSPANYGPALWLEADRRLWQDSAMTVRATAADDPIGSWESLEGSSGLQSIPGNRPHLVLDAINGHPAITFDGSNSWLSLASSLSLHDHTIFVVCKPGAISNNNRILLGDGAGTTYLMGHYGTPTPAVEYANAVQINGTPRDTWYLVESNRTGTTWRCCLQGEQFGNDQTVTSYPISLSTIGSWGLGDHYWIGSIALILIYPRYLSDEEFLAVRGWIQKKYHTPGPESYVIVAKNAEGPGLEVLQNGEYLVSAFHWKAGDTSDQRTWRSTDHGITWTPELVSPSPDGVNVFADVGMAQISTGRIIIPTSDTPTSGGERAFVLVSDDNGHVWSDWQQIALADGYTSVIEPYGRILEPIPGGGLYLPLYAKSATPHAGNPSNNDSLIYRSEDGGDSWDLWSVIARAGDPTDDASYNETSVAVVDPTHWVAVDRRSHGPDGADPATGVVCRSSDAGATWSEPDADALGGELLVSPCLTATQSGRLLLVWGYREVIGLGGIRARMSLDGGLTWKTPTMLYTRTLGNDTGYPDVKEILPGVFLLVFYDEYNNIIMKQFLESDIPII